jgi:hypothetical protein
MERSLIAALPSGQQQDNGNGQMSRVVGGKSIVSMRLAHVIATAAVAVALAGFVAGNVRGTSASPVVGDGLVSVNRTNKGDRLNLISIYRRSNNSTSAGMGVRETPAPFACDPAFSPIAYPARANIYNRCMV